MRRRLAVLVVALALFLVPTLAQTSASVAVKNDTCTAGVQLSQT